MFKFDIFSLYYDIVAYMIAGKYLIEEILYKIGFKRSISFTDDLPVDLTGHVAIVTGGTRGLGLTVVKVLISKGCHVFIASSQTQDRFLQLSERIYRSVPEQDPKTGVKRGSITLHNLDLSSMDSVKNFVKAFKASNSRLNYLICNAGIMFAPRQLSPDGYESHFAVNYLGHSLLILELLQHMKETADEMKLKSRIVSVSSSTHHITRFRFEDLLCEANYSSSQAYAQSKLAQIMFTYKLERVMKGDLEWKNVQCFSLHPGVVLSELYEHVHLIKYFPFLIPLIKLVTRVSYDTRSFRETLDIQLISITPDSQRTWCKVRKQLYMQLFHPNSMDCLAPTWRIVASRPRASELEMSVIKINFGR